MSTWKACASSIVAGCVVLLCATTTVVAQGGRPLMVVLQGNASPAPTEDPCILLNTETATGWAQGIGAVTWQSRETVNLCAGPDTPNVEGEFTITAASGDRLFGTYQTLAQFDVEANEITARGRYQAAGGTGAFDGASGEGLIGASGSLLPPFGFSGVLFGRISF